MPSVWWIQDLEKTDQALSGDSTESVAAKLVTVTV